MMSQSATCTNSAPGNESWVLRRHHSTALMSRQWSYLFSNACMIVAATRLAVADDALNGGPEIETVANAFERINVSLPVDADDKTSEPHAH